jgi:anti-sigma regulatory factor (Ser/Thr protein kinase)
MTNTPELFILPAATLVDARVAGAVAVRFALSVGFPRRAATEIGIAAGELASNIARHARGDGHLEITLRDGALELRALDRGPGALDTVLAHLAGDVPRPADLSPAQAGGYGCGIGAVRRLMDQVHARRREGGGLCVRARRARPAGVRS